MISDERKQALIEGVLLKAESVKEIRWLCSVLHHAMAGIPMRLQFALDDVMKARVDFFEFYGEDYAKGGNEMGHGAGNAEISEAAESGGEALRADPACDAGLTAPELSGDRGHEGTGAVGDG